MSTSARTIAISPLAPWIARVSSALDGRDSRTKTNPLAAPQTAPTPARSASSLMRVGHGWLLSAPLWITARVWPVIV